MKPAKTISEREKELNALLTTPAGRAQLRDLKTKYETEGKLSEVGTSVISYILVREKEKRLIVG